MFKLPSLTGLFERESARLGDERQLVADSLHGKHYQDTLRGRVFSQSVTPLGIAIPIYTATDLLGVPCIWNPIGSGVNVELIKYAFARASGITAFAVVGLMARSGVGSVIGTGQQITAFAESTPINGLIGGGQKSAVKSSNAGQVTVVAGVAAEFIRCMDAIYPAIDTTAIESAKHEYDFDGTVIVPPGTMVWPAATKASVALFGQSLVWKEIPIKTS